MMSIPEDIYQRIYRHYFSDNCIPDILNKHELCCTLDFPDVRKVRTFVAFHNDLICLPIWRLSNARDVQSCSMDLSATCLLMSSIGTRQMYTPYRKFAVHLRELLSAIKYDKRGPFQLKVYENRVHFKASSCSGSIQIVDVEDPCYTIPPIRSGQVVSTVSSAQFSKAVTHVAAVSDRIQLEACHTHLNVKSDENAAATSTLCCKLDSVRTTVSKKISVEVSAKYLERISKAYKRHYPKCNIVIRMTENDPISLEMRDDVYTVNVILAPMS